MKNTFLFILFLSAFFVGFSQTKGTVTDAYGNALENIYIENKYNNTHAHTNELGQFRIEKTMVGDTLRFTAIGFKKMQYIVATLDASIALESDVLKLEEVVLSSKLSPMNVISKIDLVTTPVKSSQEILRKVPGLFIGQHAGGGKAEQIFLRGFDIDHGTDIAINVDGMPVNMVSHAHGQGYADLHFVIPETIEKIDFGKGAYYADKGDFATAGYVGFKTKDKVTTNTISSEIGQFNSLRTFGIFNLLEDKNRNSAYIATEYVLTDGPFDSPQNFNRWNIFGKYSGIIDKDTKFSVLASHFTSEWNASGQIPQRLVDAGLISRFGAVDATEGGNTSRTNFNFSHTKKLGDSFWIKSNVFYSNYQFQLYSNFTFFLEDPINGDQIRQKENRNIYGVSSEIRNTVVLGKTNLGIQFGGGFRGDMTKNSELSHTLNRATTLESIQLGNISQNNFFSYCNSEWEIGKLKINPALRVDYFQFNYEDKLAPKYQIQSEDKVKFSPKLNFIYAHNNNLQLFLKSGYGFHSNDTRVVVAKLGKQILPASFGMDLGTVFKPTPKLLVNSSLWLLNLEQEFVYVGDAGVVEPSGKTNRMGVDFGMRYQWKDFLFLDTDLTYTHARSATEPKGNDYIPLAPNFTATAGISLANYKSFSGGFHLRYLKDRPANEDNSIIAKGYTVADANVNYALKNVTFGISAENIWNTKWNETQFATESRLDSETNSTTEIHFTPGTPFFLKAKVSYSF